MPDTGRLERSGGGTVSKLVGSVALERMLAERLLAGETGAVRCAGFLATGGGDFCFAGCS
jgi:hypothetical protein